MLQKLIADLGAHDVHFLGHVSDAELAAYYEVADLFLCASEHEGFCVPLMEAFHVGLPVVAYAATAIPATMDGGGVLYTDKDPAHVAAIVDAVVERSRSRGADRRGAGRGAGAAAGARLRRPGPRLRRAGAGDAAAAGAARRLRLLGSLRLTQQLEELHQYRPGAYGALPPVYSAKARPPRRRHDDQPVGAGRPPGRRHRRQRPPRPRSAAGQGPHLRPVRADHRRRPARRRPAVRRRRGRAAATSRSSISRCRRR